MADESAYVQVAVDGAGKKIANVAVTEPQDVDANGAAQADLTRYQQQVTPVSTYGNEIDPTQVLAQIYAAQLRTNELLELVLETLS